MESSATQSSMRYFCHICNSTITQTSTDYLCPTCNQGFIEKLSDSSASSSYDRNSEHGDDLDLPAVLDTLLNGLSQRDNILNNVNNRVQVTVRREDGNAQNPTENGPTSSNPRDGPASGSPRQARRPRRARVDSYNLNPERILTEFFNFSRNHADAGQVFLVSNPGDYAWGREGLDTIVTQLLNQMDSSGPPPLASDKIQELPFIKITEQQVSENIQCSVCWDSFRVSDNVRQLPCEHIYHDPCIVPWLQLHGTCPICRKLLSEENESRLGGFAQGGGLEALLSDVQRQMSITRRPNIRCYRCNNFGHYARECPVRGNRRNRQRGQSNYNRNDQATWGSNSYDWGWPHNDVTDMDTNIRINVWGAASAPAQTTDWVHPSTWDNSQTSDWSHVTPSETVGWNTTTPQTSDWSHVTPHTVDWDTGTNRINENANSNSWGADGWTTSNREWPTTGETTGFEFTINLSDNEDEEHDLLEEDYPSDIFSSDAEENNWEFGSHNSFTNGSSSSATYGNSGQTVSGRNYSSRNQRKCYNCEEPGHLARQCPWIPRCEVCGKNGHKTSDCWHATTETASNRSMRLPPRSSGPSVRDRPPTPHRPQLPDNKDGPSGRSRRNRFYNRQYNNSNQGGRSHPSSHTPSTSRQSFRHNPTCWNCNKTGHLARDCPEHQCCNICRSYGHRNGQCREVVEF